MLGLQAHAFMPCLCGTGGQQCFLRSSQTFCQQSPAPNSEVEFSTPSALELVDVSSMSVYYLLSCHRFVPRDGINAFPWDLCPLLASCLVISHMPLLFRSLPFMIRTRNQMALTSFQNCWFNEPLFFISVRPEVLNYSNAHLANTSSEYYYRMNF